MRNKTSFLFIVFILLLSTLLSAQQNNLQWIYSLKFYKDMSWLKNAVFSVDDKSQHYDDVMKIKYDSVIKMEVYNKRDAIKNFGKEEGSRGIVNIITYKILPPFFDEYFSYIVNDSAKYYTFLGDTIPLESYSEAEYPGGVENWTKYLQKNLNTQVPVDNGSPPGIYKAYVKFVADKDSSISYIQTFYDPGYGTAKEVIRLVKKIPYWSPAIINGQVIKDLLIQPVVFIVTNE